MLSIIAANWAKIGVDMEIRAKEFAVTYSSARAGDYELYMHNGSPGKVYSFGFYQTGMSTNYLQLSDPRIDEAAATIFSYELIGNEVEKSRLWTEAVQHILSQALIMEIPSPFVYKMWWPWVQNYRGEFSLGYFNAHNLPIYIWYDEELKKSMGY